MEPLSTGIVKDLPDLRQLGYNIRPIGLMPLVIDGASEREVFLGRQELDQIVPAQPSILHQFIEHGTLLFSCGFQVACLDFPEPIPALKEDSCTWEVSYWLHSQA